ncbi:MAG: hypothetical protein WCK59_04045, partial [Candidatus Falkowbacteria bacterium]
NCGSDGCGGTCGTNAGSCAAGQTCNTSGVCVSTCIPSCAGKNCGSDGCGGTCGTNAGSCTGNDTCISGVCQCVPNCTGNVCGGDDGCSGKCTVNNFGSDSCAARGFYSGQLSCANATINSTACTGKCGDGVIDTSYGEECDGTNLNGKDCSNMNPNFGIYGLSCSSACKFVTSGCYYKACHLQSTCVNGYTCKPSTGPINYYCTGWEGSHSCTSPVSGVNCYNIPVTDYYYSSCQTACNKLKAVTINGVANSGYCTWSIQNGLCQP